MCEVAGPPHANILLRWLGVRAVPHLPCRFDCDAGRRLGEQFLALTARRGYQAEVDDLLQMLGWPVEWSALHGIAEIKTPAVKVTTVSDATATKYVVRRRGTTYPLEVPPERAARLRERLKAQVEHLLVYVYADDAAPFGDLESLARAAGIAVSAPAGSPGPALGVIR